MANARLTVSLSTEYQTLLNEYVAQRSVSKSSALAEFTARGLDEWRQRSRILGLDWASAKYHAEQISRVYAVPLDDDDLMTQQLNLILQEAYTSTMRLTGEMFVQNQSKYNAKLLNYLLDWTSGEWLLRNHTESACQKAFIYELENLMLKTDFVQGLLTDILSFEDAATVKTHVESLKTDYFIEQPGTILSQTFLKTLIDLKGRTLDSSTTNQIKDAIIAFKEKYPTGKLLFTSVATIPNMAETIINLMEQFDIGLTLNYRLDSLVDWLTRDEFAMTVVEGMYNDTDDQIKFWLKELHTQGDTPILLVDVKEMVDSSDPNEIHIEEVTL